MKILLVEDEPLIQRTLTKLLQKKGVDVTATTSGREAITKIMSTNFDKIITDLMLQDITGFDIIEESKSKYTLEEIKQLFMIITAYTSPAVLSRAESYGCKILSKPFTNIHETILAMVSQKDNDATSS